MTEFVELGRQIADSCTLWAGPIEYETTVVGGLSRPYQKSKKMLSIQPTKWTNREKENKIRTKL